MDALEHLTDQIQKYVDSLTLPTRQDELAFHTSKFGEITKVLYNMTMSELLELIECDTDIMLYATANHLPETISIRQVVIEVLADYFSIAVKRNVDENIS